MPTPQVFTVARFRHVTKALFWNADTTTVRLILALSSLLFCIGLIIPGADFTRPGFIVMADVAPQYVWAAGFFAHFLGLSWRFLDPVPRITWALIINALGLLLWLTSSLCINFAYHTFAPGTSAELVLCFFAGWSLLRTGLRQETLTP